jgi:hypothetical protein
MTDEAPEPADAEEEERWPVGFMVMLVLVALYLGWRLVQGVVWLVQHL